VAVLAFTAWGTGQVMPNPAAAGAFSDAETAFCAYTSAATLAGVGLHTWLGWWWADPIAALVIAALAVREGLEAWHDED
jgi:divalent metal cation (Fe/Co/Zn/Cd) transporter